MNVSCLLGRHDLGPWVLRPRLIGARVEWLRWERACRRRDPDKRWMCRHVERRWFQVRVPASYRGGGIGKAIEVETYLARIHARPPAPESLRPGGGPPAEAVRALQ